MQSPNRCKVCPLPGPVCGKFRPDPVTGDRQCYECKHFPQCHKKHKYNAKRCELDGHKFASKAERDRYAELNQMQKAGLISNLRLQPEYSLYASDRHQSMPLATIVAVYRADFEYVEHPAGGGLVLVTEDVKGLRTPVYKLKAKWFAACYGREVREITGGSTKPTRRRAQAQRRG